VVTQAEVELAGGIPFISNAQLETALDDAGVEGSLAEAILEENEAARIAGLRAALAILALATVLALYMTRMVPTEPVGAPAPSGV
jgi:hypothetical protein